MIKKNQNVSVARKGMNRDVHESNLTENEYIIAMNATIQDEVGTGFNLQNEPSNLLAFNPPAGFQVVGHKYDVNTNKTYYFLTNPISKVSQIGYVDNVSNITIDEDEEICCGNKLADPLEESLQTPSQTYVTLFNDSCNLCLNFSIHRPINKIVVKYEHSGTKIFWADPIPRYLDLSNLEQYTYTGEVTCGEDNTTPTCLDCEKLKVFRDFLQPTLTPSSIDYGGNLKAGVYEVQIAYCDLESNEISSYYSPTLPISIFDENNNILTQPELEYETNFAIKLKVDNLDTRYPYYKIAIIYTGGINGSTFYQDGVYSTSDKEVIISTLKNLQPITLAKIQVPKIVYESAEGLTASNGTLFWHGFKEKEQINLQKIANILGGFLKWQTVETTEDLYEDGVKNALYKTYYRDEVYAFAIQFINADGSETAKFPLINRPATEEESALPTDNLDIQSIEQFSKDCSDTDRTKYWQFYNTATNEGFYDVGAGSNYAEIEREVEKLCIVENVLTEPELTINLACEGDYTNLEGYIELYREQICEVGSEFYDATLCAILSDDYVADVCPVEDLYGDNCGLTPTLVEDSTEVYLQEVATEVVTIVNADIADLEHVSPPTNSNQYAFGTDSNGRDRDTDFEEEFFSDCAPVEVKVFVRNAIANVNCSTATDLQIINLVDPTYNVGRFLNYDGSLVLADLYTSKTSVAGTDFQAFLHKKAIWFTYEFGADEDSFIFEISEQSSCNKPDSISKNKDKIRFTTYNNCSTTAHTYSEIVDLDNGTFKEFLKTDYPSGKVLIAIDAPIIDFSCTATPKYVITPPCGTFVVGKREYECISKSVTITDAVFSKRETYTNICTFNLPLDSDCEPSPYEYGKFGIYESTENYPDNQELYDSSDLDIDIGDIPEDFRDEYNTLIENLDFRCTPIRHYRMPDFEVSPYMSTEQLPSFAKSFIYPIGVTLNENLIDAFLNIAVKNELLTQQQKDNIVGYKIVRADRTLNKSITAKGFLFDMFSYQENNEKVLFPNFPYNDNTENKLIYASESRNDSNFIKHPYLGLKNTNYTFHSPETSFKKQTLPNELKIEAYHKGYSRGNFVRVEDHPRYVVLGKDAYSTATTLAIVEVALELAIKVGELTAQQWFEGGVTFGSSLGLVGASIVAGAYAINSYVKVGEYRKQWLDTITNLGQPKNFASYYTSVANYNYAEPNTLSANRIRAIKTSRNLKPANLQFTEEVTGENIKINNADRESSVFISTGDEFPINYPTSYINFDNSRTPMSIAMPCENKEQSSTLERQVASPYVSIKNYVPNQYGQINDIKWLDLGQTRLLKEKKDFPQFFGGDVFITRFATRTKFPFFKTTAMGLADRTPFNYAENSNVGTPKYYADFYVTNNNGFNSLLFPQVETEFKMDCENGRYSTYLKHPSKFYLSYQGAPTFLVESEYNNNYRYAKERPENNFYPNTEDYITSTQEKERPLRFDNTFFYNSVYSKNITPGASKVLPLDYSKAMYEKLRYQPNGTFYSQIDNSENSRLEPWISYKPLNRYIFKSDLGKLIDLSDIESAQVLGRFENGMLRFNAIDVLRERLTPENQEIGNAGIFAQRPIEFNRTNLGYAGTQHKTMISCEYGHFWADAKRGQVFQVNQNGEQLKDITEGLTRWYKEQLPFKILKSIPNANIDNAYLGVGISMAWDSKYKRVILTKLDKKPILANTLYSEELGYYIAGETPTILSVDNSMHFEDCSFTLAYSPLTESWISYYDFKPNFYVSLQDYFQSGKVKEGVWSHLLTNKSYQVFYGQRYDWMIEFPVKTTYTNNILQNLTYWLESRRYINEYDYSTNREVGIDRLCIYNFNNNSGTLNLVTEEPNNLFQKTKYPIQNTNSQDILATSYDKKWTVNYFFNRVKNDLNNVPHFIKDNVDINKVINNRAISYNQTYLDRLRGDYFVVRMSKTKNTQFKTMFKFNVANENSYN